MENTAEPQQINTDNSTEMLDPAARRRLQNRLNQRASSTWNSYSPFPTQASTV